MLRGIRRSDECNTAPSGTPGGRSLLAFLLLTFGLSVPFWVFGAATERQWLPGLPAAAMMVVCPGLSALMLAHREEGSAGFIAILGRAVDYRSIPARIWFIPVVLLTPAISVLSYITLRVLGTPIPAPHISILTVFALLALFLVSAFCEELGWSGYALDQMQDRWGTLRASLLLGAILATWHWVPLVQMHRSVDWIAWWTVWTLSSRVIMTWLYNQTGRSVLGAILYHAVSNLCWQVFPIRGSYWDPRVTGLITLAIAIAVVFMQKLGGTRR